MRRNTSLKRLAVIVLPLLLLASAPAAAQQAIAEARVDLEQVRAGLTALAHDSMEGRRTGTAGARRAALWIEGQMRQIGLEPAGDSGYYQRVPLARREVNGRQRLALLPSLTGLDSVPAERLLIDANVLGLIRGGDADLREEVVVVGAHYDHIGIVAPVDGDSIANGADDDASGVIAMLEIARAMASGPPPARTIVFVAFTGEEMGLLGTRHYIENPTVPLEQMAAQLQIEMIGRPDSLAGGHGRAWLTGYERSTLGDMLRDNGSPIVPDPRPSQNFFERSDNIAFARRGVPAHTLSSFNLHTDYHRVSDDVDGVDFEHMTAVIQAAVTMTRQLADGRRPEWHPGGRPGATR
jgi:hypothetical protein